jgi:hypothetical protein
MYILSISTCPEKSEFWKITFINSKMSDQLSHESPHGIQLHVAKIDLQARRV